MFWIRKTACRITPYGALSIVNTLSAAGLISEIFGLRRAIMAWLASLLTATGCAMTHIEQRPDGTLFYESGKNIKLISEEYNEDGSLLSRIELVGDASNVIDSQVEAVKAGVELGRKIGAVP